MGEFFKKAIGTDMNGRLICYHCGKHGKITIQDRVTTFGLSDRTMTIPTKDADELTAIFDKSDNHIGYLHESCENIIVEHECPGAAAFIVPVKGGHRLMCLRCGFIEDGE